MPRQVPRSWFAVRSLLFILQSAFFILHSAPAAEKPPALPPGVEALREDLSARMKSLQKAAEKFRGLRFKSPVPSGGLGEDALRAQMRAAVSDELPASKMDPLEAALKTFGFIPETMALNKYYPELLTSQVGGYYDPKQKYLVIVQREGGLLGKEAKKLYGEELAERMEETVLVHELTHALQDQHFNLRKFTDKDDPLADASAAHTALIEGDATLTMYDYFSGLKLEEMPGAEPILKNLMNNPQQLMDMALDMPGGKELAAAPSWIRDNLLFSYLQGLAFCLEVKRHGGQKLLDYAFSTDPPRSTEQILHPEKWYGKRDDPVLITLPDLSVELPGYAKVAEGTLGEESIKILLNGVLKDNEQSSTAAAGWGGDHFAVYQKGDQRVLVWITEWDTQQDRDKFMASCVPLAIDGWWSLASGETRVLFVKGDLTAKAIKEINKKLAEANSARPDNKQIDVSVLEPGKEGGDQKGGIDLSDLLNNPEIKKIVGDLLGGNKGDKGKDDGENNGPDLSALLKSPEMQKMVESMMKQERPQGKLSADGRTYLNEGLGFSISLPAGDEWTMDAKPPIPMAAVLLSQPRAQAQIFILTQELPVAIPIYSMGPMLELGSQMSTQNYKKLSSGAIKTGTQAGYEVQFQGSIGGQNLRTTQRFYIQGAKMLVLTATAPPENWAESEKGINEALNSFTFTPQKAAPATEENK